MDVGTETTRSRENTRARLLDAAAEVFAEVGIGEASVEAICERAGFTRGAFYSNFASKDQLFLALSERNGQRQLELVRQRIAELEEDPDFSDDTDFGSLFRLLDTLGSSRDEMVLLAESRVRAMRDETVARELVAQNRRFLGEVTAIIEHVAEVRSLTLRMEASEAAELITSVWEASADHAIIAGISDEERDHRCHERVIRIVRLLVS